jgi:hypothetical protein
MVVIFLLYRLLVGILCLKLKFIIKSTCNDNLASGRSTVVEHLPHNPKVEGSSSVMDITACKGDSR